MKTNLMRTAYNIIIYEALDFTTGLFTAKGETVSIGLGLPMFIRGMAETVKAKIRHFGLERMEPGDIFVTNDAYTTGSHLNHVTLTLPIFHKGVLGGVCLLHGALARYRRHRSRGVAPTSIPRACRSRSLKYQDARRDQPGPRRHHPHERAHPEPRDGRSARAGDGGQDRRAALPRSCSIAMAATNVLDAIAAIMDHSEATARARTRTIPDGVYEAESFMDDDGVDVGKKVPIKVRVDRRGRRDDDRSLGDVRPGARASTIRARPPAMAAPRSPINA